MAEAQPNSQTPLLEKNLSSLEGHVNDASDFGSRTLIKKIAYMPYLIWHFTESDFYTFVIPNSSFGILGAFVAPILTEGPRQQPLKAIEVLWRVPLVLAFNWFNLLIFDMANQWTTESIEEDRVNKPWRPIPTGKVTGGQTRCMLLASIPLALLVDYILGVSRQGLFIVALTWMYNDLRGGDGVVRNPIISVAYAMFNTASLEIAIGGGEHTAIEISHGGKLWTAMISGVILTTMHVQDLKDQAGDRTRRRETIVLWLGNRFARWSIAVFICFWSVACVVFWHLSLYALVVPASLGIYTAFRVICKTTPEEDANTWRCWSVWTMTLYFLPILGLL